MFFGNKIEDNFGKQSAYQQNLQQKTQPAQKPAYTASDVYGMILQTRESDPQKAQQIYSSFQMEQQNPQSRFYNPYTRPTNRAVESLATLGFDTSVLNDEWFAGHSGFISSNLIYNGTTNSPSKPGASATRDQHIAYNLYQWQRSEEATKKAEQQWEALQEEITYLAQDEARNLSDEEILRMIDWSKYGMLTSMDENMTTSPVELNRAIGYSREALQGVLWKARNPGYEGGLLGAMGNSALGMGDSWKENPDITARLNVNDPETYSPYSVGMTMGEAGKYFGVYEFTRENLDEIAKNLDWSDSTAVGYYRRAEAGFARTEQLKGELQAMNDEIDQLVEMFDDPETIIDLIRSNDEYSELFELDETMTLGAKYADLVPTTSAIPYRWADMEQLIRDKCETNESLGSVVDVANNLFRSDYNVGKRIRGVAEAPVATPPTEVGVSVDTSSAAPKAPEATETVAPALTINLPEQEARIPGVDVDVESAMGTTEASEPEPIDTRAATTAAERSAIERGAPDIPQPGLRLAAPKEPSTPALSAPVYGEAATAMERNVAQSFSSVQPIINAVGTGSERIAIKAAKTSSFAGSVRTINAVQGDFNKNLAGAVMDKLSGQFADDVRVVSTYDSHVSAKEQAERKIASASTEWEDLDGRFRRMQEISDLNGEQWALVAEYFNTDEFEDIRRTLANPNTSEAERESIFLNLPFAALGQAAEGVDGRGLWEVFRQYLISPLEAARDEAESGPQAGPVAIPVVGKDGITYQVIFTPGKEGRMDFSFATGGGRDIEDEAEMESILGENGIGFKPLTTEELERHEILSGFMDEQESIVSQESAWISENQEGYAASMRSIYHVAEAAACAQSGGADIDGSLVPRLYSVISMAQQATDYPRLPYLYYDYAVSSGQMTREEAVEQAGLTETQSAQAAQDIRESMEFFEKNGVQITEDERKNLSATAEMLERESRSAAYVALDGNDDFADVVESSKEEAFGKIRSDAQAQVDEFFAAHPELETDDAESLLSFITQNNEAYGPEVYFYFRNQLGKEQTDGMLQVLPTQNYMHYLSYMTDEEIDRYFYLRGKDGPEAADAYIAMLTDPERGELLTRAYYQTSEGLTEATGGSPLGAAVGTLLSFIGKPFATAEGLRYRMSGGTNPYAPELASGSYIQLAREGSKEYLANLLGVGDVTGTIYDVVAGLNDMYWGSKIFAGANQALEGSGLAKIIRPTFAKNVTAVLPLAIESSNRTFQDVMIRTNDPDKANRMAVVAFASDLLTSTVVMSGVHRVLSSGGASKLATFTKNLLVNAGAASLSTLAGETFTRKMEQIILDEDSEWGRIRQKYLDMQYSTSMAEAAADKEIWGHIVSRTLESGLRSIVRTSLLAGAREIKEAGPKIRSAIENAGHKITTARHGYYVDKNGNIVMGNGGYSIEDAELEVPDNQIAENIGYLGVGDPKLTAGVGVVPGTPVWMTTDAGKTQMQRDSSILTASLSANPTAAAVSIASVLDPKSSPTDIITAPMAAAQQLVSDCGDPALAVQLVHSLLFTGVGKNDIAFAALTAGEARKNLDTALSVIKNGEMITPDIGKAISTAVAADRKADPKGAEAALQSKVHDIAVANKTVSKLKDDPAVEKVKSKSKAVKSAKSKSANAKKALKAAKNKIAQDGQKLVVANEESKAAARADGSAPASEESNKAIQNALAAITADRVAVEQAQMAVDAAEETLQTAQAELDDANNQVIEQARAAAIQEVEQEQQAAAEISYNNAIAVAPPTFPFGNSMTVETEAGTPVKLTGVYATTPDYYVFTTEDGHYVTSEGLDLDSMGRDFWDVVNRAEDGTRRPPAAPAYYFPVSIDAKVNGEEVQIIGLAGKELAVDGYEDPVIMDANGNTYSVSDTGVSIDFNDNDRIQDLFEAHQDELEVMENVPRIGQEESNDDSGSEQAGPEQAQGDVGALPLVGQEGNNEGELPSAPGRNAGLGNNGNAQLGAEQGAAGRAAEGQTEHNGSDVGGGDARLRRMISDSLRSGQEANDPHLEVVDHAIFAEALNNAKANSSHGLFVDEQSPEDLAANGAITLLSPDGMAGVAVETKGDKAGNIVGVFNNSQGSVKHTLPYLMTHAIMNGGNKLDCYDGFLSRAYERYGFIPVARVPWEDKYHLDDGWNYDRDGRPDVIVWMHNGDSATTVAQRYNFPEAKGGYHWYTDEEMAALPVIPDYGAALAFRDSLLSARSKDGDFTLTHSLSIENAIMALKVGGIAAPSIAVSKKGITNSALNFGDVAFGFGASTVDPAVDARNKLYGADAATPFFPKRELSYDPERKVFVRLGTGEPVSLADAVTMMFANRNPHNSHVKEYDSALDMIADSGRLVSYDADAAAATDFRSDGLYETAGDIAAAHGVKTSDIADVYLTTVNYDEVPGKLAEKGINLSEAELDRMMVAVDITREKLEDYFEAKPEREISSSEITYAIIPTLQAKGGDRSGYGESIAELEQLLKEAGIPVFRYNSRDERAGIINSVEGVTFRAAESRTPTDENGNPVIEPRQENTQGALSTYHNNRLYVSPEVMDHWLSSEGFASSNPQYAQAYIATMNPADYLALTEATERGREQIRGETTPLNQDGKSLDRDAKRVPIQLKIDEETGKIVGQEGRHRSIALANAGITEMPVLIFGNSEKTKYTKEYHPEMVLTGLDREDGSAENNSTITLHDVMPLSNGFADQIRSVYVASDADRQGAEANGTQILQYNDPNAVTQPAVNETPQNERVQFARSSRVRGRTNTQAQAAKVKGEIISPQRIAKRLVRSLGYGDYLGSDDFGTLPNAGNNGRVQREAPGYWDRHAKLIAVKDSEIGNYVTTFHEVGHGISQDLGIYATPQMVDNLIREDPDFASQYTVSQLPGEAMAEFMWRYMEGDDLARSFAGDDFVDNFERQLTLHPGINKAVSEARAQFRRWVNATSEERFQAIVRHENDPAAKSFKQQVRTIINEVADSTSIAQDVDDFAKSGGTLRRQALFANHSQKRAIMNLTDALTDAHGTIIGEGLVARLKAVGFKGTEKNIHLFEEYCLLLHSERREEEGKPIFGAMTEAERKSRLNEIVSAHPEFVDAEKALQSFRRDFQQAWLVDTGYWTQEFFDHLNKMYPHYVPTYRIRGNERTGSMTPFGRRGKRYTLHAAVGGSEDIYSPMYSFIAMVDQITSMVATNQIAQEFDRLYQETEGMGIFGREIFGEESNTVQPNGMNRRQRQLRDLLESHIDEDLMQQVIDIARTQPNAQNARNQAGVLRVQRQDGTIARYEIDNPELYKLLTGVQGSSGIRVLQLVGNLTRTMSMLTTGSNPLFAARNAIRDFQNSVNYGSWASNYATGALKWLGALAEVVRKGDAYKEYRALGGGGWQRIQQGNTKNMQQISNEMFGADRSTVGKTAKWLGKTLWKTVTLEKVNEWIEQTSRMAEYKYGKHDRTTAEGRQEAFQAAQDATVDFARSGNSELAYVLKKFVPFFNASMQGVYRTLRQGTKAERGRAGIRLAKNVINTALVSALSLGLILKFGDEEDKEEFGMLSDGVKANHFILPNPAAGDNGEPPFIRIPIAQDPVSYAVHGLVTNALWNGSDDEMAISLGATADVILDNMNPLGSGTIAQPFIDASHNRTWYGSSLVRTNQSDWVDEGSQFNEDTPGIFKWLGRMMNKSPEVVEYLFGQYSGFVGSMATPALSVDDNGNMGGFKALWNSVVRKWTADPASSNDIVSGFYDMRDMLTTITGEAKAGKPQGLLLRSLSQEEVDAANEEAAAMLAKGGIVYETAQLINETYRRIDEINGNGSLSDDEKAELSRKARLDMIRQVQVANEEVQKFIQHYVHGETLTDRTLGALQKRFTPGATAHVKTTVELLPDVFQSDIDTSDYMIRAMSVYNGDGEGAGKSAALPHPDQTFTLTLRNGDKQDVTIPEEDWPHYTEIYRAAYMDYIMNSDKGKRWDFLTSSEQYDLLKAAAANANKKMKQAFARNNGIATK